LPKTTPFGIRSLLQHCLQKDLTKRFHDAADARLEIEGAAESPSLYVWRSFLTRSKLTWALAAVIPIAAIALAILHKGEDVAPPPPPAISFAILPPMNAFFAGANLAPRMALSPDGRYLAFTASMHGKPDQIWIRRLDSIEPNVLRGTEGAQMPFWSPDSRFVAFFADGRLKKIEAAGGPVQTLCNAPTTAGGSWNHEGTIIFSGFHEPLNRVSSDGGTPKSITKIDEPKSESHLWPQFLPDGRHFLYMSNAGKPLGRALYVGSLDSKNRTRLFASEGMAIYASSGYLLYISEGTLVAQKFDSKKMKTMGAAKPLAESVISIANGRAAFSLSETGILAYRTRPVANSQLAWIDRKGKLIRTLGEPAEQNGVELSPDGKRALISIEDRMSVDIWLWDLERSLKTRLTFGAPAFNSIWSPDGGNIMYTSVWGRSGPLNLLQKASSGSGDEELAFADNYDKYANSWSPDGRYMLYMSWDSATEFDLNVLPLFGDRKPFPFLKTPFMETMGQFSPDGRWVVYVSNESGVNQVFVTPFPGPGRKWLISTGAGDQPRWRRDGSEIFFVDYDSRQLMAASVNGKGRDFSVHAVNPLFDIRSSEMFSLSSYSGYRYDVSPDGRRFLANMALEQTASTPITVVLNWTSLLKK